MHTKRVLLTGGRAPSTLELSRLFASNGHSVHVADSFSHALTKRSKAVSRFHLVHEPKEQTDLFIDDLITIIKKENIDWLIPTCEEIFYIAKYQDTLSEVCDVFVDSFEQLISFHDKYHFITTAMSLDLSVPHTILLRNKEEWLTQKRTMSATQRSVIKPVFSRFSSAILFLPKDSEKEVSFERNQHWVMQEFIEGTSYCSYSVARNGEVHAHTVYKSEFRAGDGASVYFKHINHKKINTWVNTFIKQTSFHGQIGFDFIETADGDIFAIECNPRLTSGVHLFRDTNLSSIFLGSQKSVSPNENKAIALKAVMLLYAKSNINQVGAKKFLYDFFSSNDAVFIKGDKKPYIAQVISLVHLWKLSKKNKISLIDATTHDISWDGDEA